MKSLELNKPHLIVVVGLPGSGKSFFASKFSKIFNAPHVDYAFYRNLIPSKNACSVVVNDTLEKLLQTGQTILIEGLGNTREGRKELRGLARKNNYKPLFVWVQTDPVVAEKRATKRKNGISTREFEQRVKKFQQLEKIEPYLVISGKHTHQTQARTVLKKLASEKSPTSLETSPIKTIRRTFLRNRSIG